MSLIRNLYRNEMKAKYKLQFIVYSVRRFIEFIFVQFDLKSNFKKLCLHSAPQTTKITVQKKHKYGRECARARAKWVIHKVGDTQLISLNRLSLYVLANVLIMQAAEKKSTVILKYVVLLFASIHLPFSLIR